jgi:hypothetical protein
MFQGLDQDFDEKTGLLMKFINKYLWKPNGCRKRFLKRQVIDIEISK